MIKVILMKSFLCNPVIIIFAGLAVGTFLYPARIQAAPAISNISDNRGDYPNNQIPRYEKLEISFGLTGVTATNYQWPYDTQTPAGIQSGQGITVNAQFTSDNWQTVYTQPAFYYQDFDYQVKNGQDWIYPKNTFMWKVRFTPNVSGNWMYRLTVQDAGGSSTSTNQSFTVTSGTSKGFVRVSQKDSRYFEFSDGTYFPGLGYNMNFDQISWNDPVQGNRDNFTIMGNNGIQLIRMWLSQWSIFGSFDNPWRNASLGSDWDMLAADYAYPGHDFSLSLDSDWERLYSQNGDYSSIGWMYRTPAVKPNTTYRFSTRFFTPRTLTGPRVTGTYGFTMKLGGTISGGGWLDDPTLPTAGIRIAADKISSGGTWDTITGDWTTGDINFLPMLYVVMENVSRPNPSNQVFIDELTIQEVLPGGGLGPNIIPKALMAHHQYFQQEKSYAFDKVVDLAHQEGIYLKVVGMDKNDYILNHIDYDGNNIPDNDTASCPGNNCFYGYRGDMTKVYWLQRAWWRYLQARWGYSTNIHSWELLNEGDPGSDLHYTLANNFGAYMHQFKPNDHLVTTSLWAGFPQTALWTNPGYSNLDYADFHRYISRDNPNSGFYDTASASYTAHPGNGLPDVPLYQMIAGTGKPVMRGETGLINSDNNTDGYTGDISADSNGVWLHNLLWGQVNPGGLIDSGYWYTTQHIYPSGRDLRPEFGKYYNFISSIPLSNGNYRDAVANVSGGVRAWGQKDLVNKRAHLWIANSNYQWNNQTPAAVSGTVTVTGFSPNSGYKAEWWNTHTGTVTSTQTISSDASGNLPISINNLVTDLAVRIGDYSAGPTSSPSITVTAIPTPTPMLKPGDANGDGRIDDLDYTIWANNYGIINATGPRQGDFNNDHRVDDLDYTIWANNYGK